MSEGQGGRATYEASSFEEGLLELEVVGGEVLAHELLLADEGADVAPQVVQVPSVERRHEPDGLDVGEPRAELVVEPLQDRLANRKKRD